MIKRRKKIKKLTVLNENIDHAKREIKMDQEFIRNIILRENYSLIFKGISIGSISDESLLKNKFSCHYNLEKFNEVSPKKQHLITGFGPTNAPTGGTLSIILRAIFFKKETGIDSTIIISNLGAFNSRNINIERIDYLTKRFIKFIRLLGYKGELRTHSNFDLLVSSSLTSKVLTIKDLLENKEVTIDLYKKLGIQGKDFPTFIDANFTIADILLPSILCKKERILVFVGIEEYYFPKLANIVIQRFNKRYLSQFVPKNTEISAAFGHLIEGLNGFPKMSKSIPESSINLEDSYGDLKKKFLKCKPNDERIILQMINLVSDWDLKKIECANESFKEGGKIWINFKKEYLDYFVNIKRIWESTADEDYKFNIKSLFRKRYE